jgi:hypothetical protein
VVDDLITPSPILGMACAIACCTLQFSGVARLTRHAGQSRLLLTLTNAAGDQIKSMIANIHASLSHVMENAPQLPKSDR